MCYILFMCVCGCVDLTIAFDDPKFLRSLCRVHQALSWGVPWGARSSPLVMCNIQIWVVSQSHGVRGNAPNFFGEEVFDILVDFAIFSGFLN
jgi:hypothetical protein